MNDEQASDKQAILKVPLGLRIIGFCFWPLQNKYVSTVLSIILLSSGYALGAKCLTPIFLTAASGIVGAIGLILTIKNSYLKNISSVRDLAYGFTESESCMGAPNDVTYRDNPEERNRIHSLAYDEGVGVMLVILAAVVNGIAPFLF